MQLSRIGHRPTRLVAVLALLAVVIALIVYPRQTATAKPPPNPSDGQIQNAKTQKADLATLVGKLSGQVASMQQQLQQLEAEQELAEQKLAYAISKLQEAKSAVAAARAAATVAKAKVEKARGQVAAAQRHFVAYLQASYTSGEVGGTTGTLLTADDPSVLLEAGALRQYQSDHQISAIGDMQRASVAKSNADAVARRAVQKQQKAVEKQKKATTAATIAKQNADASVSSARQQTAQLQQAQAHKQQQLQAAQSHLATLNHQRAAYNAYQVKLAKERAERARQKRIQAARAEAAHQAYLARQRAIRQAQERVHSNQSKASRHGSSHHSSSGGGSHHSSSPPAPSGGGWSAARGRAAVSRAEQLLGVPYAWAGGNSSGPTYGVCAGDGAWNDCHVRGVDCSGLTLYAWAPYMHLDHYTVTQYGQAGSYHPSIGNLMPGDLVFWSSNGARSGIHHVAIYTGGGMVIQAPFSGSYVQRTPLSQVSWGYYGATRPLT